MPEGRDFTDAVRLLYTPLVAELPHRMANDLLRRVTGRARSACEAQGIIASTAADHAQWRPDTAPQADATLPAVEGAEGGGASDGTQPCRLEMAIDGVKAHIDGRGQAPKVATLLVRRLPVQPEEPTRGPLVARRYLGLLGSELLVTRIKSLSRDAGWVQIPVAEIRGDGTPWMWQIALLKAPSLLLWPPCASLVGQFSL